MACSFKKKDIVKAFFDLDLSAQSSRRQLIARSQSRPAANFKATYPSAPATNNSNAQEKLTLLTLPAEIRIIINGLLLVSRFDRRTTHRDQWPVGKTCQNLILLHTIQHLNMERWKHKSCKRASRSITKQARYYTLRKDSQSAPRSRCSQSWHRLVLRTSSS